jgi:hypothetical protein
MTTALRSTILAISTLAALVGSAQAFDIKLAPAPKVVPTSAQLGIISPPDQVCPGQAKLTAWIRTNVPGTVNIVLVRKNGDVSPPISVTTTKGANGIVMGSYSRNIFVKAPIDAQYRVVIAGTPVVSNWAPLAATC